MVLYDEAPNKKKVTIISLLGGEEISFCYLTHNTKEVMSEQRLEMKKGENNCISLFILGHKLERSFVI